MSFNFQKNKFKSFGSCDFLLEYRPKSRHLHVHITVLILIRIAIEATCIYELRVYTYCHRTSHCVKNINDYTMLPQKLRLD